MSLRPGGELASRPLHFIWIADCSGSMAVDGKIQSLNNAIREALPSMKQVADGNPNAEVFVRAVSFSNGASWHVSQPTKIDDFVWKDLEAGGVTDLGKALSLVADQLEVAQMPERGLPPVLVLLSDGQPTDDYAATLTRLLELPWGKKAVRIAIAIGADADLDVLHKFIAHPEIAPLQANNAEQLVKYIKWASTAVLKSASSPASQTAEAQQSGVNVPIPLPPTDDEPSTAGDVW